MSKKKTKQSRNDNVSEPACDIRMGVVHNRIDDVECEYLSKKDFGIGLVLVFLTGLFCYWGYTVFKSLEAFVDIALTCEQLVATPLLHQVEGNVFMFGAFIFLIAIVFLAGMLYFFFSDKKN